MNARESEIEMRPWALVVLVVLSAPALAGAQLGPPPVFDRCGTLALRVGRRAARAGGWSTADPVAEPIGTLGRGSIWRAVDNPRSCAPHHGGGGSSDRADALVGVVGTRLFALTGEQPDVDVVPAGENRLVRPFSPRAWAAYLRAAGAVPSSEAEALAVAWLVYASAFRGLGRVDDASTLDAALVSEAIALLGGPVSSAAVASGDHFDVTIWASRQVRRGWLRDCCMGSVGDEELRRTRIRIGRDGAITVSEDVPVRSSVQVFCAPP